VAAKGDVDALRELFRAGADVSVQDKFAQNAQRREWKWLVLDRISKNLAELINYSLKDFQSGS